MHLIVDIKNYAKFEYFPFIGRDNEPVPHPLRPKYKIGQVVYIKPENALGVVLGCIDEQTEELRTDMSGMVAFVDLEPADKTFFYKPGIRFVPLLYKEVFGKKLQK